MQPSILSSQPADIIPGLDLRKRPGGNRSGQHTVEIDSHLLTFRKLAGGKGCHVVPCVWLDGDRNAIRSIVLTRRSLIKPRQAVASRCKKPAIRAARTLSEQHDAVGCGTAGQGKPAADGDVARETEPGQCDAALHAIELISVVVVAKAVLHQVCSHDRPVKGGRRMIPGVAGKRVVGPWALPIAHGHQVLDEKDARASGLIATGNKVRPPVAIEIARIKSLAAAGHGDKGAELQVAWSAQIWIDK